MKTSVSYSRSRLVSLTLLLLFLFGLPSSVGAAIERRNHVNEKLAEGAGNPISVTTSSFTPPNNSLLVVVIGMVAEPADVRTGMSVSGGGLQWTKRMYGIGDGDINGSGFSAQSEIWTAQVTTGSSMSVTITDDQSNGANTESGPQVQVFSFTGHNVNSPIGATGSKDPMALDGADSFAMSPVPAASSLILASVYSVDAGSANNTFNPGTGWAEIQEGPATAGYGNMQTQVASSSPPSSVSWNDLDHSGTADAAVMIGLAIEIKAASGAISKPPNNLGLIGYWSLDDATSTIATDYSGNRNVGTGFDGGSGYPAWVDGKRGKALRFNGDAANNNYVTMGDVNAMDGMTQFTVSAWIKSRSSATNWAEKRITEKSFCTGNPDDGNFELVTASGKVQFYVYPSGSGGTGSGDSTTNVEDAKWHHVTGRYDGGRVSIWVDGVQENFQTPGAFTLSSNVQAFSIGGHCSGNGPTNDWIYDGTIDEVRVYNRSLSTSTIQTLARAGAVKFSTNSSVLAQGSTLASGLLGHWTFDGGDTTWTSDTAGSTRDKSGNNNAGTLTNMGRKLSVDAGKLGQAFRFDGVNDRVGLASNITLPSSGTFSAWVYLDVPVPNGDVFHFIAMNDGDCAILFEDDETLAFWNNGVAMSPADGKFAGPAIAPGVWRHVVVNMNNTVATAYVDGTPYGSTVDVGATFDCEGSSSIDFGGSVTGGNFFNGRLDDIRIYNRVLTPIEVKQLYNLGQVKSR